MENVVFRHKMHKTKVDVEDNKQ